MIVVAILGILTTIAIPTYQNYIRTSEESVARASATTLEPFLMNYWMEQGTYLAATYAPGGDTTTIPTKLGWRPDNDTNKFKYVITACPGGDIANCYKIEVFNPDGDSMATVLKDTPP